MARRLPTKMWAVAYPWDDSTTIPHLRFTEAGARRTYVGSPPPPEGMRIGSVMIVWEKPVKKKVRR